MEVRQQKRCKLNKKKQQRGNTTNSPLFHTQSSTTLRGETIIGTTQDNPIAMFSHALTLKDPNQMNDASKGDNPTRET